MGNGITYHRQRRRRIESLGDYLVICFVILVLLGWGAFHLFNKLFGA